MTNEETTSQGPLNPVRITGMSPWQPIELVLNQYAKRTAVMDHWGPSGKHESMLYLEECVLLRDWLNAFLGDHVNTPSDFLTLTWSHGAVHAFCAFAGCEWAAVAPQSESAKDRWAAHFNEEHTVSYAHDLGQAPSLSGGHHG